MPRWMKKSLLLLTGVAVLLAVQPVNTLKNNARILLDTASHIADSLSGTNRLNTNAAAAVLLDLSSGKTLVSKNADTPLPPASMSKMMTEYLTLEAIEEGKLHWEDKIRISSYAAGVIGSKVPLRAGDQVSVRDLLAAVTVVSANDAAIALAEHMAGSEESFAARMNQTAKKMGLSSASRFINATGLSRKDMGGGAPSSIKGEQTLTAGDTAKLAARLVTDHPEILDFSVQPSYQMDYRSLALTNTNLMLQKEYRSTLYVKGMDGLKTGFTDEAGYCFTGTALIHGKRYVSVVMGTSNSVQRFEETKKLLTYGAEADGQASTELSLGL